MSKFVTELVECVHQHRYVMEHFKLSDNCNAVTITEMYEGTKEPTRHFGNYFLNDVSLKRMHNRIKRGDIKKLPEIYSSDVLSRQSSNDYTRAFHNKNMVEMLLNDASLLDEIFVKTNKSLYMFGFHNVHGNAIRSLGYPLQYNLYQNINNEFAEIDILFGIPSGQIYYHGYYPLNTNNIDGLEQQIASGKFGSQFKFNNGKSWNFDPTIEWTISSDHIKAIMCEMEQNQAATINPVEYVIKHKLLGDLVYSHQAT